jgi:hypothetical protein
MSSTGPGSLLVFLAFLMLSMLLAGTYFVAYLGLVQAGREVQKAGEAASEQAIVYLFQHPTNISMVDGRPVVKGETRIVIQNVGSRDISFDRILAISPGGSVVADVKVPGNKGLGVRQWQIYKVQDLSLPERWSNFTIFSSEVSRLVLLSERGRTHGSIWGVPPFLEGTLRATLATTMTTSFFYSYIETTSYQTTYTITIKAKQSRYSLTGEWWESNDGRNWGKVTSTTGRDGKSCSYSSTQCQSGTCEMYCGDCTTTCNVQTFSCDQHSCTGPQSPTASQLASSLTANGRQTVGFNLPIILYFMANESIVVSAGSTSYTLVGDYSRCYTAEDVSCQSNVRKAGDWYCVYSYTCIKQYTEWSRTYQLQAIELVDWDTGEVYASVNQTSLTFNINRNTIVRFKSVLTSSWSQSWEVILQPPPPTPDQCQQILNDPSKECSNAWCNCLRIYDPEAWKKKECCQPPIDACLDVSVSPCCSGDETFACLNSWSGQGGSQCVKFTQQEASQGITKPITVSWGASWSLKPGWALADIGKAGPAKCNANSSGNSASGSCTIDARAQARYWTRVIVIFKKTQ